MTSLLQAIYPPFRVHGVKLPSNPTSYTPLNTSSGSGAAEEDSMAEQDLEFNYSRSWWSSSWPRINSRFVLLFLIGVFGVGVVVLITTRQPSVPQSQPGEELLPDYPVDISNLPPSVYARLTIDALYARQSTSLKQASARYTLKTNRPPPPNFDKWFTFARHGSCLIDDYDQIHRDFAPFYQLADTNPTFFKKMIDLGSAKVKKTGNGMKTGEFQDGYFRFTDRQSTLYTKDWTRTFKRFGVFLPDMNVILNGRDEPRVLFNHRQPDVINQALNISDPTPFEHRPSATSILFKDQKKCFVPNKPTGFTSLANDASAFLIQSASTEFTLDLYPMLSMTKISPCFSDILVPSEFYYSDSHWSPKYPHPNNIAWSKKKAKLYWRGSASGGTISGPSFRNFPRFRLIDIGRNHSNLMDVALTKFSDFLCIDCDKAAIKKEYGINGKGAPREEGYQFKYLFDVDGNSFSGRYFGLLRTGSLVFKSTIFEEYFNDWLKPYVHYIPVLPDMSDIVEKLEWAVDNDEEAHRIQETGRQFAERVLTDAQNDCYFFLVLLEWARLQEYAEKKSLQ
ncbi:glycosyl transferase family 90-domain-containing protein [Mycena floridula]|nr:glycosyl transferase family 90-domain-containing protein [Mycena floridula]